MTAGLQVGGVALSMIGASLYRDWYWEGRGGTAQMIRYAGFGLGVAGTIYGFYRGYTQYNTKMAVAGSAGSFAEAIGDNPMNNISLVAFPAPDGRGFAGALTYAVSF